MTSRPLGTAAALALALAASGSVAAPAAAQPPERGTFTDVVDFTDTDFCGTGMTVVLSGTVDVRYQLVFHGDGAAPFYRENSRGAITYTNPSTGASITETFTVLNKDLEVDVDADGVLTALVLSTGNSTIYDDSTGAVLGRNPGQVRFAVRVDENDPDDPDDDEFEQVLVKGSTGRSDDFCEAVLPVLFP